MHFVSIFQLRLRHHFHSSQAVIEELNLPNVWLKVFGDIFLALCISLGWEKKKSFCEEYSNWLNRKLMWGYAIVSVKRLNFCCLTFHYEREKWGCWDLGGSDGREGFQEGPSAQNPSDMNLFPSLFSDFSLPLDTAPHFPPLQWGKREITQQVVG